MDSGDASRAIRLCDTSCIYPSLSFIEMLHGLQMQLGSFFHFLTVAYYERLVKLFKIVHFGCIGSSLQMGTTIRSAAAQHAVQRDCNQDHRPGREGGPVDGDVEVRQAAAH